jgi:hypothetical protein
VYQWRNLSSAVDAAKINRSLEQMERMSQPPAQGGILTDMRVFPYFFGYEELPKISPSPTLK